MRGEILGRLDQYFLNNSSNKDTSLVGKLTSRQVDRSTAKTDETRARLPSNSSPTIGYKIFSNSFNCKISSNSPTIRKISSNSFPTVKQDFFQLFSNHRRQDFFRLFRFSNLQPPDFFQPLLGQRWNCRYVPREWL